MLIEKWIEIFNNGNAEDIAELYHEDAVNHQIANDPVTGKNAIREMFSKEFSSAEMTCIPEQILEDGEWGILEWKDPLGLRGCGFFHVIDGKLNFNVAIGINCLF